LFFQIDNRLFVIIRTTILLLAFVVSPCLYSQSKLDSLDNLLANTTSDSVRILLLLEKAKYHEYSDYDIAKKITDEAMRLAEEKDWSWAKSKSYHRQSFLSTLRGDYSSALRFSNMRLPLTIEMKDTMQMANALNFLGNTYFELGEYDEAYYYFTKSFRLAESVNDSVQIAIALHNVGNVFRELGQHDIALSHLELSQKMSERINDRDGAAYSLKELGDVYLQKGDNIKAEELLTEALRVTRRLEIGILEPETISKLAELYLKKKEYEKALAYYDTAAQLNALTHNSLGEARARLGKGQVYLNEGEYDRALQLIDETLAVAKQLQARILEIQCMRVLSDLYEKKGEYKESLEYLKDFNRLQDMLFSQDMLEKLFQDQVRFETETKDIQIAALSRARLQQDDEIKRQEFIRNILVVVVALSVILLFTVYRSGQRRIRINKLLVEHQDEIKRRSIELEQLNQVKDKFFSIISHDLRSPINALAGILDLLEKDQIKPGEFSKVVRELKVQFNHTKTLINNLLDWALLQMDKLKIQSVKIDLKSLVSENFKLLGSLHLKDIRFVNEVAADAYALADPNMINLVFRNLILNGIKFTESGGTITIKSKADGDRYLISVADTGVGITREVQEILFEKTSGYSTRGTANEKGTGLGLILCKEFVERNGGKIWVESEIGKGSTFYFTVKKFS
jgi:signal transduction histidine kinase